MKYKHIITVSKIAKKIFLKSYFPFICFSIAFSSCIFVQEENVAELNEIKKSDKSLQKISLGKMELEYFIYRQSQFPLEKFSKKLIQGDFIESFKSIDLSYKASNIDNEVIEKLISKGLIPVYVNIKNHSDNELNLSSIKVVLNGGEKKFNPIQESDLPGVIKELNIKAIGANLVNLSAFAVSMGALIIAAVVTTSNYSPAFVVSPIHGKKQGKKLYNKTQMKTNLKYKNLLFNSSIKLPSNQSYGGLLFFKIPRNKINDHDLSLSVN